LWGQWLSRGAARKTAWRRIERDADTIRQTSRRFAPGRGSLSPSPYLFDTWDRRPAAPFPSKPTLLPILEREVEKEAVWLPVAGGFSRRGLAVPVECPGGVGRDDLCFGALGPACAGRGPERRQSSPPRRHEGTKGGEGRSRAEKGGEGQRKAEKGRAERRETRMRRWTLEPSARGSLVPGHPVRRALVCFGLGRGGRASGKPMAVHRRPRVPLGAGRAGVGGVGDRPD
jgi:hypothetical protein